MEIFIFLVSKKLAFLAYINTISKNGAVTEPAHSFIANGNIDSLAQLSTCKEVIPGCCLS